MDGEAESCGDEGAIKEKERKDMMSENTKEEKKKSENNEKVGEERREK